VNLNSWTLVCGGVEKTFAGWGLRQPRLDRVSLHPSKFVFVADGQPYDTAALFAYKSQITVWRDRTAVGAGGMIYFQGYVTNVRHIGKWNSETVQYTVQDVLWLLTRRVYVQHWAKPGVPSTDPNYITTSHVILNMATDYSGDLYGVRTQIQAILDQVLGDLGAVFTYDVSGIPSVVPPTSEKRDVTAMEAIKSEAQWIPGMVSWVDHSQTPPKINFIIRYGGAFTEAFPGSSWDGTKLATPPAIMPVIALDLGDGVSVASADIVPLNEMVATQAVILFEETSTLDGASGVTFGSDAYPATPDNGDKLNIFQASIDLQGTKASDQSAVLSTAVFSPNNTWWISKHQELSGVTGLTISSPTYTTPQGEAASVYSYELLNNGCLHDWMSYNNVGLAHNEVVVHAVANYTDAIGVVHQNEDIHTNIKTCNLPSCVYTRQHVTQLGEGQPTGMAYTYYTLLSVLQYEGEVEVDNNGGEVSAQQFLGCLLCLNNGLADWQTMSALVQSTSEDLETGKVTVKFGQNRYLNPGQVMDLLRATRTRNYSDYTTSFAQGSGSLAEIVMPSATAKQDSTRGNGLGSNLLLGTPFAPDNPIPDLTKPSMNVNTADLQSNANRNL